MGERAPDVRARGRSVFADGVRSRAEEGSHVRRIRCLACALCALAMMPGAVLAQAGTYDTDWRPGGRALITVPGSASSAFVSVAESRDRLLLAANRSPSPVSPNEAVVVRLTANGTLDPTFGAGGVLAGLAAGPAVAGVALDERRSVTTHARGSSDGNSVRVVLTRPEYFISPLFDFEPGTSPVPAFGRALAVAPGGRVMLAGDFGVDPNGDFGVLRLLIEDVPPAPRLRLDPSFAVGGRLRLDFGLGAAERVRAIAVDASGGSVVVGWASVTALGVPLAFARFRADGSLDQGFGSGGLLVLPVDGFDITLPIAVAFDSQGRVVYALTHDTGSAVRGVDMLVGRLTADGAIDPGFGVPSTGRTSVGFNNVPAGRDTACCLVVQPDDAVVVGGAVERAVGGTNFGLARLDVEGRPDLGFGEQGKTQGVFSPNAADEARLAAMALDSRNRLLIAGSSGPPAAPTAGIARILTGLLPPDAIYADQFEP